MADTSKLTQWHARRRPSKRMARRLLLGVAGYRAHAASGLGNCHAERAEALWQRATARGLRLILAQARAR
jgi:hypothetical protein